MDINLNNLTDEELNTLMTLLQKAQSREDKVWTPQHGDKVYRLDSTGVINEFTYHRDSMDLLASYELGLLYPTKAEAIEDFHRRRVNIALERFAEQFNDSINWDDESTIKYSLVYNHEDKSISTVHRYRFHSSEVYFSSESLAMRAVAYIGAENLKKYYFRVVD